MPPSGQAGYDAYLTGWGHFSGCFRNSMDGCTRHKNMMETLELSSKPSAKSDFKK